MMDRILAIMIGLAFALSLNLVAAPALFDRLTEKYSQIEKIEASFQVEKKSKFLVRPIRSEVELRADKSMVLWTTLKPVKSIVRIEGANVVIDGRPLPDAAKSEIMPLTSIVRSLMLFKIKDLSENFDITADGNFLEGVSKSNAVSRFFDRFVVEFDQKDNPISIQILRGAEESTKLKIVRMQLK